MTQRVTFSVRISHEAFLTHYQGVVSNILVQCHDGRSLQLPANLFRQYVTHEGISGHFLLEFDDKHQCQQLIKLPESCR